MRDEAAVRRIIDKMPDVSRLEYARLVRASGWTDAPRYERAPPDRDLFP